MKEVLPAKSYPNVPVRFKNINLYFLDFECAVISVLFDFQSLEYDHLPIQEAVCKADIGLTFEDTFYSEKHTSLCDVYKIVDKKKFNYFKIKNSI